MFFVTRRSLTMPCTQRGILRRCARSMADDVINHGWPYLSGAGHVMELAHDEGTRVLCRSKQRKNKIHENLEVMD